MIWTAKPEDAWVEHILPVLTTAGWIENSRDISADLKLSRRELLGIILVAHAMRKQFNTPWLVGYDPADGDQNDGHVTDGTDKVIVEHKVVAQMDPREVLSAIKGTYTKYVDKGGAEYGKNRTLIIHPNKSTSHGGMIKISELRDQINNQSPFDRVITMGAVAQYSDRIVWHLVQHYPDDQLGKGSITQIDLYYQSGKGEVLSEGIDWTIN